MRTYDIFISYASEDRAWVEDRLLRPLQRCRTTDGRRPEIFFDRDDTGLQVGEAWEPALAAAIKSSLKFVPVYSRNYFSKEPCTWELGIANRSDLARKKGKINGVLLDPTAASIVPVEVENAQFVSIDIPDWFARLCKAIGLEPGTEVLKLSFREQLPATVAANDPLPSIGIEVQPESGGRGRDVEITLASKFGEIRGELTVFSRNGVAEFHDISFAVPYDKPITLLASADNCVSASSSPLKVVRSTNPAAKPGTLIHAEGDPVFFSNGKALAVMASDVLGVWSMEGGQIGQERRIHAPIRIIVRSQDHIALADWAGRVCLLGQDGQTHEWNFGGQTNKLAIPGAVALVGGDVYIGFWNGTIYRLQPGNEPALLLHHPVGVQALAAVGSGLAMVDLGGRLMFWEGAGSTSVIETGETCIHSMKSISDGVNIVGERNLLKYFPKSKSLMREPLRLGAILAVLADVDCPIVCDAHGHSLRFNAGLTAERFQVPVGACPVSADNSGIWAVFRQSDGNHLLMRRHQVVYTCAGSIAVSPDGRHFVIEENRALRLLDSAGMEALINRA